MVDDCQHLEQQAVLLSENPKDCQEVFMALTAFQTYGKTCGFYEDDLVISLYLIKKYQEGCI